ncbi:MAG: hypothetical protein AAB434_02455 [Planctomycetota bacterium]
MSWIRGLLTQNLMTKVLAFVLAVLVWSFVELEVSDDEARPRVKIELEFEMKDVSVVEITALDGRRLDTVEVKLSGPRGALSDAPRELTCRHLVAADATAEIDPRQRIPITLSASDLRLPPRVFATITPDTVYVTLDRLVDGYVPIKANKEDLLQREDMRPDLEYEVLSVLPPRIKIRAAAAVIAMYQKDGIPILPVDVSGLTQTTPFAVSFPEFVRQRVQIGANQQAIVTIRIEPKPEEYEATVPVVMLLPPGGKHDFELRKPKEVKIKLRGPKGTIDRFKQQPAPPVQIYVDLADYKVTPAQEGGIISDAPIRWVPKSPEQYPGLQVLGVPDKAEEVFVRKKE